MPVTTSIYMDNALKPRELIVGLTVDGVSKAYPIEAVVKQKLILDELGRRPLFLVTGEDGRSVRAFERSLENRKLEFFVKPNTSPVVLIDAETGSEWDFTGKAIAGPLSGKQLSKIAVLNDYWFDWKTYHPNTFIYELGNR